MFGGEFGKFVFVVRVFTWSSTVSHSLLDLFTYLLIYLLSRRSKQASPVPPDDGMRGSEGLFDDSKHVESKPDLSGVELIVWTLVDMMLQTLELRHAVASGMDALLTLQENCFHKGIP